MAMFVVQPLALLHSLGIFCLGLVYGGDDFMGQSDSSCLGNTLRDVDRRFGSRILVLMPS